MAPQTEPRWSFEFEEEPRWDTYEALLEEASSVCSEFMLADTLQNPELLPSARAILAELEADVIDRRRVRSRPGYAAPSEALLAAIPHAGLAEIWRCRLTRSSISVLARRVEGLFSWDAPHRPADLAFFRHDAELYLSTVCHERFGVIDLSERDAEILCRQIGVRLRLMRDDSGRPMRIPKHWDW